MGILVMQLATSVAVVPRGLATPASGVDAAPPPLGNLGVVSGARDRLLGHLHRLLHRVLRDATAAALFQGRRVLQGEDEEGEDEAQNGTSACIGLCCRVGMAQLQTKEARGGRQVR